MTTLGSARAPRTVGPIQGAAVAMGVVAGALVTAACTADPPGAVTVELTSAHERYSPSTAPMLTLVVRNGSDGPCSVPRHGIGSVRIVSVERDGVAVPSTSRVLPTFAPAVDAVRASLTDLEPGAAQALDVAVSTDPAAVQSQLVDASGGLLQTTWPVAEPGRYRVTADLAIPAGAARPDRAPVCDAPGTTSVDVEIR